MKKIIVLAAAVCALGAFTNLPQADATRQATAEPVSILALMQTPASQNFRRYIPELGRYREVEMLALMQVPASLKSEAYDAI